MITIYGAGAIGGTSGAALARTGNDVPPVDADRAHVGAMNRNGLAIERELVAARRQ